MCKNRLVFCDCGRIHFIKLDIIDKVCPDKKILHICNGCGKVAVIGLSPRGDDSFDFFCNYIEIKENLYLSSNDEYYSILSSGCRLLMQSGSYADSHRGDFYINEEDLLKEIGTSDISRFSSWNSDEFRKIKSINVDMDYLQKKLTEEELDDLRGFLSIRSFDWHNTPYELKITHAFL